RHVPIGEAANVLEFCFLSLLRRGGVRASVLLRCRLPIGLAGLGCFLPASARTAAFWTIGRLSTFVTLTTGFGAGVQVIGCTLGWRRISRRAAPPSRSGSICGGPSRFGFFAASLLAWRLARFFPLPCSLFCSG